MGRHTSDGRSNARESGAEPTSRTETGDDFGFEADRTGSRRGWAWGLTALALVALLISSGLLWRSAAAGGGCGDARTEITVASDPAMAQALQNVASIAEQDTCFDYDVEDVAGADAPGRLLQGDQAPDLWVADSAPQARRVIAQVRRSPEFVTESIAVSPTVVAGKNLGEIESWVDVMKLPNLRIGSPIETSTGDAPIIGALAAVESGALEPGKLTEAMTLLAVQQNNARPVNDNEGTRLNLANTSDTPVVTTEQQFDFFVRTHPGSELTATIPTAGTVMLDYPVVNTAGPARREVAAEAGAALVAAAESVAGIEALNSAGFRTPEGAGVGEEVTTLTLADESAVDRALRQWQVLGIPIRTLVVQDTSGSMAARAGDATRAELLINASMAGLGLFPNNTQIGGWAFSIDRGGQGQDWEEMIAIRRLDAPAPGGTHRDATKAAVREALGDLGGGTGLYDTTLAAYKAVQESYDPSYSNSVIIMTDGQNEDPNSISLQELLAELERLEDPARPVLVLTIGISEDADTESLKTIAEATGGTTYVAETPEDINSVFLNAISARVQAAGR